MNDALLRAMGELGLHKVVLTAALAAIVFVAIRTGRRK